MRHKIIFVLLLLFACLSLKPVQVSAFWWFNQTKTVSPGTPSKPVNNVTILDDKGKEVATAKYKIWADSFEKEKIDQVIANKNNFWFTVSELNYIFATETKKAKSPIITNFNLTTSQDNLNIVGDFHKIINGHFSFIAKPVTVDKKARLEISYVKLYGMPIPAKWLADPLNKALDEFFSFLYKDPRYQGFTFLNKNNALQFIPEFKN